MDAPALGDSAPGALSPAEREAPWTVWVRFAIKADGENKTRAIAGRVFGQLELPLSGEPRIQPLRLRDRVWVVAADST